MAKPLRGYLDTLRPRPDLPPTFGAFGHHLDTVSRSDWPGLFHCDDVPGLPRTNNEIESRFRDTSRSLLRTTGQKGLTKRTLQRHGAWELLPRPPIEAQLLNGLRHIPPQDLDPQEGAQRDELLYLQVEVLPAQFPIWRRSHIRQSLG